MKTWFTVLLVLAAALAAWLLYARYAPGIPVEAARVAPGSIREFVDEQAKTRLPNTYLVTMPTAGRIEPIELREGDPVYQGQTVARMTPLDLEQALEAAEAALGRIDAAIVENDDASVELTGLAQARSFVQSMAHAVEAAAARVRAGEARRDFAEKRLARLRSLEPEQIATQEEIDQAEVNQVESNVDYQQDVLVHAALAALKAGTDLLPTSVQQYIDRKRLSRAVLDQERLQAEVQLRMAQRDRQRGEMQSPIDGTVLSRLESNERYLPAGTVLLEIGRLDELEIEADVLSQDAVRFGPGAPAEVYGAAVGPRAARAVVDRVYPAGFTKISSLGVEEQRVKVVLRLEAAELARLRRERALGVGYRVQVRIFTAAKEQVLLVPRSALFRGAEGDWQVFAVRQGRARLQNVRVGLLNDEAAEIAAGLAPGDIVVLAPETDLVEGTKVSPLLRNNHPPPS